MSDDERISGAHWYVVHTYSGYENKVKVDIEKTIANRHLEEQILEVSVPIRRTGIQTGSAVRGRDSRTDQSDRGRSGCQL